MITACTHMKTMPLALCKAFCLFQRSRKSNIYIQTVLLFYTIAKIYIYHNPFGTNYR